MDFKLGIYGLLSIVFIGALSLFAISYIVPSASELVLRTLLPNLLIGIVASYAVGMVVLCAAREIFSLIPSLKGTRIKEAIWKGMTEEQRNLTVGALREFYGMTEITPGRLEALCVAPVHDRLSKRDEFVAAADFCRSMALLALLSGLAVLPWTYESLVWRVPLLSASWLFARAYRFYTGLGAVIVYGAFLSWWREKRLTQPTR